MRELAMSLQDDNGISFWGKDENESIDFDKGIIEAQTYGYGEQCYGNVFLSQDNTYKLYLKMKEYYETFTPSEG